MTTRDTYRHLRRSLRLARKVSPLTDAGCYLYSTAIRALRDFTNKWDVDTQPRDSWQYRIHRGHAYGSPTVYAACTHWLKNH